MVSEALYAAYDEADSLIRHFTLHASWPVDLAPLESRFLAVSYELGPDSPKAFTKPASRLGLPPIVILDRFLPPADRRLFYAHEVAHLLCAHVGSVRCMDQGGAWIHDRQEAEAWAIAAYLLIPLDAWGWGEALDEVAARCGVPRWLAEKYDRVWTRFG